jgi:hypothetical protein
MNDAIIADLQGFQDKSEFAAKRKNRVKKLSLRHRELRLH